VVASSPRVYPSSAKASLARWTLGYRPGSHLTIFKEVESTMLSMVGEPVWCEPVAHTAASDTDVGGPDADTYALTTTRKGVQNQS
jgi:hypothetical protein